jgi:hypothetical protein
MIKLFCKHKWFIVSEITTESKFQIACNVMGVSDKTPNFSIPHYMCDTDRKLIQIVSCEKCGTLKKFVEDI